ncbi:ABC transporter permease [Sporolactobacillus nakayamae]|uniref:Oligopeptide transport system permease protein n=1 Tax=Sporolactobacillus nakayamae TaxID=269670 RepID=A0A1I2UW59_9BACL|nr:ABC transporter permease [Sporolactobacillus nakayamae]SFG79166.1 oligopeptide transport system permease protein [Sporolactobacillus nakayamae]
MEVIHMIRYIGKRTILSLITLFIILFILFLMLNFMPGSPFNDTKMSHEQLKILYHEYGLDRPLAERFLIYVKQMLTGNLGVSYSLQTNATVTNMISHTLPISVQIGLQASVVGSLIGIVLGFVAALRKNSFFDSMATGISILGVSVPSFVLALCFSYIFSYKYNLFPLLYSSSEAFRSTILPTLSLCFFTLASIARYSRSEMIEVMEKDYIRLADAKGITRFQLVCRHIIRNAMIPIITVLAPLTVDLMAGSLVIEKAFSIPGMGSLYINAIQANDYNVVIGISFIYSLMFIGTMFFVDLLYGLIDPRIRIAKRGK